MTSAKSLFKEKHSNVLYKAGRLSKHIQKGKRKRERFSGKLVRAIRRIASSYFCTAKAVKEELEGNSTRDTDAFQDNRPSCDACLKHPCFAAEHRCGEFNKAKSDYDTYKTVDLPHYDNNCALNAPANYFHHHNRGDWGTQDVDHPSTVSYETCRQGHRPVYQEGERKRPVFTVSSCIDVSPVQQGSYIAIDIPSSPEPNYEVLPTEELQYSGEAFYHEQDSKWNVDDRHACSNQQIFENFSHSQNGLRGFGIQKPGHAIYNKCLPLTGRPGTSFTNYLAYKSKSTSTGVQKTAHKFDKNFQDHYAMQQKQNWEKNSQHTGNHNFARPRELNAIEENLVNSNNVVNANWRDFACARQFDGRRSTQLHSIQRFRNTFETNGCSGSVPNNFIEPPSTVLRHGVKSEISLQESRPCCSKSLTYWPAKEFSKHSQAPASLPEGIKSRVRFFEDRGSERAAIPSPKPITHEYVDELKKIFGINKSCHDCACGGNIRCTSNTRKIATPNFSPERTPCYQEHKESPERYQCLKNYNNSLSKQNRQQSLVRCKSVQAEETRHIPSKSSMPQQPDNMCHVGRGSCRQCSSCFQERRCCRNYSRLSPKTKNTKNGALRHSELMTCQLENEAGDQNSIKDPCCHCCDLESSLESHNPTCTMNCCRDEKSSCRKVNSCEFFSSKCKRQLKSRRRFCNGSKKRNHRNLQRKKCCHSCQCSMKPHLRRSSNESSSENDSYEGKVYQKKCLKKPNAQISTKEGRRLENQNVRKQCWKYYQNRTFSSKSTEGSESSEFENGCRVRSIQKGTEKLKYREGDGDGIRVRQKHNVNESWVFIDPSDDISPHFSPTEVSRTFGKCQGDGNQEIAAKRKTQEGSKYQPERSLDNWPKSTMAEPQLHKRPVMSDGECNVSSAEYSRALGSKTGKHCNTPNGQRKKCSSSRYYSTETSTKNLCTSEASSDPCLGRGHDARQTGYSQKRDPFASRSPKKRSPIPIAINSNNSRTIAVNRGRDGSTSPGSTFTDKKKYHLQENELPDGYLASPSPQFSRARQPSDTTNIYDTGSGCSVGTLSNQSRRLNCRPVEPKLKTRRSFKPKTDLQPVTSIQTMQLPAYASNGEKKATPQKESIDQNHSPAISSAVHRDYKNIRNDVQVHNAASPDECHGQHGCNRHEDSIPSGTNANYRAMSGSRGTQSSRAKATTNFNVLPSHVSPFSPISSGRSSRSSSSVFDQGRESRSPCHIPPPPPEPMLPLHDENNPISNCTDARNPTTQTLSNDAPKSNVMARIVESRPAVYKDVINEMRQLLQAAGRWHGK